MTLYPQVDSEGARKIAQDILSERRFKPSPVPRPFQGLLRQLGDWLRPVGEALRRAFDEVAGWLPGGRASLWTILGAIVVVGAGLFAARLGKRRARVISRSSTLLAGSGSQDPASLERAADDAERSGDLELVIRLRFKAGLLRLGHARLIEFRDSITSREVSGKLHSPTFDRLAHDFDEVVYGRRAPRTDDVEIAKTSWARVLTEAGSR